MSRPLRESDAPSPTIHTLGNGVRVICDPIPGLETVALSVVAGRGARFEDAERSGWSHLLEHMVFKGAGERSAREIVEVIEAEGGQINAATGYERTSFQVRALKGGLDLGMAVISDLLLRPTLDAADLEREKQVVAQEIAMVGGEDDERVVVLAGGFQVGDEAADAVVDAEHGAPVGADHFFEIGDGLGARIGKLFTPVEERAVDAVPRPQPLANPVRLVVAVHGHGSGATWNRPLATGRASQRISKRRAAPSSS